MSSGACVVLCSVPNEEVAETIARMLVEERLCACVNIVPGVRSIYRWNDQVQDDRELLLVMKTQRERLDEVERRIQEAHPYEVCEVVALEALAVAAPYLAWLLAETSPS